MATNLKTSTPAKPSKTRTISKVRVVVRVRPFLAHESASTNVEVPVPCVSLLASEFDSTDEVSVHLKDPETSRHEYYKLDGFYGQEDNNVAKIFEKEVSPLIPGIFSGCNATVFAYGATGSGKTYTMQGTDEQLGLVPLAMSKILSMCHTTGSIAEISYYEVYLDRCYDLLELKAKEISVLDDKEGQIHLKGLSQVRVNSMCEFHKAFARGVERRKVAHTSLNDVSSRSHGVLVITVSTPSDNRLGGTILAKLNLIDLAGNEDNKRSGNGGIRMQESAKINQSLFALSNVIYALNSNRAWVPYRESKLTRILQDSLGGTSRALIVACSNPGAYQESVHTVSLAARSRHISNVVPLTQKQETPKVKVDMEQKLRAWLESKGKTKNAQITGAFASPFSFRTPGSMSSLKKKAVNHSFAKSKVAGQGTSTVKDRSMSVTQRKLFVSDATCDSHKDGGMEDAKECISSTKDVLTVHEDDSLSSNSEALNFTTSHHRLYEEVQERVPKENVKERNQNVLDGNGTKSTPSLNDELMEENASKSTACHSPLRKALSPVNSNLTRMTIKENSSRDNIIPLLLESSAPRTPFVVTREKFQDFDTPLDKFYARSSNMKSFLVEEYIDFLNNATREELVALKGIGLKRAEYIMERRETSPMKSLSDLEKIGLSSKQVNNMFSKVAKGIFE